MPRPTPILAFAIAALGIAVFSSMDAVMKGLSLAIGAYSALLWRSIAGVGVSGIAYALQRPRWPGWTVMRVHLIRGVVSAVMAILFFWGLARVPMAQAISLAFIAPILALFLAALLLGERVSRRTWAASLLAFGGVGVILLGQAQAALGRDALWGAVAVLASAVCYAWNIILMRQQALLAGPREVAFYQSLIVALLYLPAAPWLAVSPFGHGGMILLAAVLATVSLLLMGWAYAHAEASYLAPSEYTAFVWAALFGWAVFGERVSPYTLAGAVLIIAACVWAARRKDHAPVADLEAAI